ncbi:alpha/beta hydrolase [Rubidibacter lacunae]|nr:alpha/beta hydrolase [Rubidibacter lacunae]
MTVPTTERRWGQRLHSILALGSFLAAAIAPAPAIAAEEIRFFYSVAALTLRVESLAAFAADGTTNANIRDFLRVVKPTEEEKAKFQRTLVEPVEIDPLLLSRLLNTDEGDRLLTVLGNTIEIQGGINGKPALRAAMIEAANEPGGLTVLGFFEQLPVNMQINLEKALWRAKQAEYLVGATERLVAVTKAIGLEEAEGYPAVDFAQLPNPATPGSATVVRDRWDLEDPSRDRSFYVDVYRPQSQETGEIPVVVFSHGLTDEPESFSELGELLASQGFLVVMPQHPGSDELQAAALIDGTSRQIFHRNEFIDRPLDISYTLNELERRNEAEFGGRLNLTNVGSMGHSFGGYTALATAGATLDFEHLERDCTPTGPGRFNTALLLQCRALKLEQPLPNLKDDRVGSVFLANPVNASIFGPNGLANVTVPVMVGAGSYDLSTPFVFEQARSFPWLANAPESFLLLIEGDSHVPIPDLDGGSYFAVTSVIGLTLPSEDLRDYYAEPFQAAFAQVFVAGNEEYRAYLNPAYAAYLSQDRDFDAVLIPQASAPALQAAFAAEAEEFRKL